MTELSPADDSNTMMSWGNIWLDQQLAKAIDVFLSTSRKEQRETDWHARCMAGQAAATFFNGDIKSSFTFRVTASALAANAYADLRNQVEVTVIRPAQVEKVRLHAKTLRANLPAAQYLPLAAGSKEFRSALDSLSRWSRPVIAPTSRSGDASAIAFTLTLAKQFAIAFGEIPVEYIHALVILGWPTRSPSATRRVLPADVTAQIRREVEIERPLVSSGRGAAQRFIASATTTRHVISDADGDSVAQLQHEVDRIRQGKTRFCSDAARLRAMLEIAQSCDDPTIVADLSAMIVSNLQEFSS